MKDSSKNPRPRARSARTGAHTGAKVLNVLIACEESQAECSAFRNLGHNAFSCDLQPCRPSGNPDWHIQGDVTPYLAGRTQFTTQSGKKMEVPGWDLIIAHPPCTYLCKLSSCILYKDANYRAQINGVWKMVNEERYKGMLAGRQFFRTCLNANAKYVAVENPIPMRAAQLPRPDAYACPSWYGVKYTKKTCYWLKNLPPLFAGCQHDHPKSYVNASRGKYRSRTFPQLAEAIAVQWSGFILDEMKIERNHPEEEPP